MAPSRPERVYVAGPAGVFRSNDAGEAWEPAQGGLQDGAVTGLALDSTDPERVFAATDDSRLYQTRDGGNSWEPAAS